MSQNGDFNNLGSGYITFGLYPQSKKSTNCIVGSRANRRGFYMGGDGELYGKAGDDYFKVEPIKWKILSCNNGELFVVADDILDAHRFDENSNNYADSEIRKWLNNDFYHTAFNEDQKAKIVTTNVDNSLSSTGDDENDYICDGTHDKIFLLSNKELGGYCNTDYSARLKKGSDYAIAQGLFSSYEDCDYHYWWLRSPGCDDCEEAQAIDDVGYFGPLLVGDSSMGILPALIIKVDAETEKLVRNQKTFANNNSQRKGNSNTKSERKVNNDSNKDIFSIGDYKEIGRDYITFGTYPQSKKASNVTIGKLYDNERGYYLGSDNCLYDKYDDNYYKVEPIKWKVLSRGGEMFIVADDILDAHRFDISSNNYANSEIRGWLNNEFYNKAFNDSQKNKIVTTNVDNSLSSTGDSKNEYVCGNTSDKVFLLSRKEARQYLNNDEARKRVPSEYAVAIGAWQDTDNDNKYKRNGKGCGVWWLRSPYFVDGIIAAKLVYVGGAFDGSGEVCSRYYRGVVCALKIEIDSETDEEAKAGVSNLIVDFLSLSPEDRQKVIEAIKNGDLKL